MKHYEIAAGMTTGSALFLVVEPPVVDPELSHKLTQLSNNPHNWGPTIYEGSALYPYPLPTIDYMFEIGRVVLHNARHELQKAGHEVTVYTQFAKYDDSQWIMNRTQKA